MLCPMYSELLTDAMSSAKERLSLLELDGVLLFFLILLLLDEPRSCVGGAEAVVCLVTTGGTVDGAGLTVGLLKC